MLADLALPDRPTPAGLPVWGPRGRASDTLYSGVAMKARRASCKLPFALIGGLIIRRCVTLCARVRKRGGNDRDVTVCSRFALTAGRMPALTPPFVKALDEPGIQSSVNELLVAHNLA